MRLFPWRVVVITVTGAMLVSVGRVKLFDAAMRTIMSSVISNLMLMLGRIAS
ncbi:hypothetical protein D3C84_1254190 [compost metagenome]